MEYLDKPYEVYAYGISQINEVNGDKPTGIENNLFTNEEVYWSSKLSFNI